MSETPMNSTPETLLPLLRSLPFLADLEEPVLSTIAEGCQLVQYGMGQPLTRIEAYPHQALLVMQGRVRTVAMSGKLAKGVTTLQHLGSGSLLG